MGQKHERVAFPEEWWCPLQESIYRCLIDIAAGMDYLHSLGVINGDLKPANVLLKSTNADARGYTCKVRLLQSNAMTLAQLLACHACKGSWIIRELG